LRGILEAAPVRSAVRPAIFIAGLKGYGLIVSDCSSSSAVRAIWRATC
jgi:hypothetical protein